MRNASIIRQLLENQFSGSPVIGGNFPSMISLANHDDVIETTNGKRGTVFEISEFSKLIFYRARPLA